MTPDEMCRELIDAWNMSDPGKGHEDVTKLLSRYLADAGRWIPVGEKLPEKHDWYPVVYVARGKQYRGEAYYMNRKWIDPREQIFGGVTHWTDRPKFPPLPEPPA